MPNPPLSPPPRPTVNPGPAGIVVGPDGSGTTIRPAFGPEFTSKNGYGIDFKVDIASTTISNRAVGKDGYTTYTVSTEVSVGYNVGATVPAGGGTFRVAEGIDAKYEVRLPPAAPGAKPVDPRAIDPFNPSTIPIGGSVQMDSRNFAQTEFEGTFRGIAVQTDSKGAQGTSMLVERTGQNTIRVTTGPTQAIEAYQGVGFQAGPVSATIGRADSIQNANLRTATFDVSTMEGRAAYQQFLLTGKMPEQNTRGVSDVQEIRKLDLQSSAQLRLRFGESELQANLSSNNAGQVYSFRPDGSVERTTTLQYGGGSPLTYTQQFDANGRENVNARTYAFTINVDNQYTANFLNGLNQNGNRSLTGDAAVKPGQTVTLTFTEAQMRDFMKGAETAYRAMPPEARGTSHLGTLLHPYGSQAPMSTQDFAISMARNMFNSPERMSELLYKIADGADGKLNDGKVAELPGQTQAGPRR
jgi:hypothetical protein